jgi:glycosyltransferase involved in cell wall biosynthesis
MQPEIFTGHATGDPDLDAFCNRPLDCDTILVHTAPELMSHWLDLESGKRIIGYTVWETDTVPAHWVPILNRLDHLLVPCRWNKTLFQSQGVQVPISVVPHLPGPAHPAAHPRWASIPSADLVFYCLDTWSARKNLDQTLRLFRQCFTQADPVRFVVKTTPWPVREVPPRRGPIMRKLRRLARSLRRLLPAPVPPVPVPAPPDYREDAACRLRRIEAETPGGARVDLVTEELTDAEVEGLHARGDCYLSLTHGEGWGLGAFDAAAAGKPVVITAWGGVLDYLDPAHAGLVGWKPIPVQDDDDARNRSPGEHWAQPRLTHAAALMRAVLADPDAARKRARAWQTSLQARFRTASILSGLMEILAHG